MATSSRGRLNIRLGFERELPKNIVVNIAYVGDTTRSLLQDWNYNQIPAGAQFLPEIAGPACRTRRPRAFSRTSRTRARCRPLPAADPRVWRHHRPAHDRPFALRLDATPGLAALRRHIRTGRQLHLREGLGDDAAAESRLVVAAAVT